MKILLFEFCLLSVEFCAAQQHKTEKLIIVTLDGMRWQEVFGEIDSQIAPTLAALLGFNFAPDKGTAEPIKSIFY